MTYDKNGNIQTLLRNGEHDDLEAPLEIDNLEYRYHGNQLHTVIDHSLNPNGFKDSATNEVPDYWYDGFGNMIHDENKGIHEITYNHLNLPITIDFGEGKYIHYLYTAQGKKVSKQVEAVTIHQTTSYDNGFQYIDSVLEFFPHAEGYVRVTDGNRYNYVYNYTDHLGNIRLSYGLDPQTNVLKIMEESHYYPFGLKHKNYNMDLQDYQVYLEEQLHIEEILIGDAKYKYKLNGKEWQDELGLNMYAMDLRQYDPAIARWVVQDPVTHHSMSPYNAFDNNPVFWADPSGADSETDYLGRNKYDRHGLYIAPNDRGQANFSHGLNTDDCPPGDPNCNKGSNGKIENKSHVTVDSKEGMADAYAMLLAISASDGPLPFGDGVAASIGLNIMIMYAVVHGSVGIINSLNESVLAAADVNWVYAKQQKEIERVMTKEGGPPGMVYMLTVNQSGTYPDVRGNSVYLNAGEVWKYGETTKGYGRYKQSELDVMVPGGVKINPIFFGNTVEIKVQEKIMIYGHYLATGSLPPGNKIFR